jgi:hypothetical protein
VAARTSAPQNAPVKPPPPIKKLESRVLEKMRANQKGDWTVSDIETVCKQLGMTLTPAKGSHCKVSSPHIDGIFIFPAKRPIKRWYIKNLLIFADVHVKCCEEKADG